VQFDAENSFVQIATETFFQLVVESVLLLW